MSNEERIRVLQMVAEGKVSPAEADDVLAALEPTPPAMPFAVPGPDRRCRSCRPTPMPESKRQTADRGPGAIHIRVSEDERSISVTHPGRLERPQQQRMLFDPRRRKSLETVRHPPWSEHTHAWTSGPRGTTLVKLSEAS